MPVNGLNDSWAKFLQTTYKNSDQIGQGYVRKMNLIMSKFVRAFNEHNLREIVASLVETVPYMKKLLPHVTRASIRNAYVQVIHQVEILANKNPRGQKGFDDLYEYLRRVTAIVDPVIHA